jgi:hypothetical protein
MDLPGENPLIRKCLRLSRTTRFSAPPFAFLGLSLGDRGDQGSQSDNELHPMGGCRTSARGICRVISVRFNSSQADSRAGKDSVRILVYVRDPAHPQGYGVRAPAEKARAEPPLGEPSKCLDPQRRRVALPIDPVGRWQLQ